MGRWIGIVLVALVGCQSRDQTRPASGGSIDESKEISGLPLARPVETEGDGTSPPKVTRGDEGKTAPVNTLFPTTRSENDQRSDLLHAQQQKLDRYHVKKENSLGVTLPRVHLGELSPTAPRVHPR